MECVTVHGAATWPAAAAAWPAAAVPQLPEFIGNSSEHVGVQGCTC